MEINVARMIRTVSNRQAEQVELFAPWYSIMRQPYVVFVKSDCGISNSIGEFLTGFRETGVGIRRHTTAAVFGNSTRRCILVVSMKRVLASLSMGDPQV